MEKVIAIDIGASKVNFQIVDRNGNFEDKNTVSLVGLEMNNDKFADLMSENISPLIGPDVKAISIGSPGPLDSQKGIIEDTTNLKGIKNFSIVDDLKNKFNLPVFLLNDADAAGIGEWWLGAGRGFNLVFYITLSSGVGSAYVLNGKLQRGLGSAPESGHTDLFIKGEKRDCSCGGISHAESYLGTKGLAETYSKIFEVKFSDLTPEEIYSISIKMREGMKVNDTRWLAVQDTYSDHLASFLRNVVYNFQPEIIVLGGGIIFDNQIMLKNAQEQFKKIIDPKRDKISTMAEGVKIDLAKLKNNVNLGAAKYALEQLGINS